MSKVTHSRRKDTESVWTQQIDVQGSWVSSAKPSDDALTEGIPSLGLSPITCPSSILQAASLLPPQRWSSWAYFNNYIQPKEI